MSLSKKQISHCEDMIKSKKLKGKVKYVYADMLSDVTDKKYDAIVMLESIEHVGEVRLQKFIDNLQKHLNPNGYIYIQATGQYKKRRVDKFILKYVFPGGYLPPIQEILDGVLQARLKVKHMQDDTSDYIATLSEWISRLEKNKQTIEGSYGSSFYRLWYLWLHAARISFETDFMSLFRILLRK